MNHNSESERLRLCFIEMKHVTEWLVNHISIYCKKQNKQNKQTNKQNRQTNKTNKRTNKHPNKQTISHENVKFEAKMNYFCRLPAR